MKAWDRSTESPSEESLKLSSVVWRKIGSLLPAKQNSYVLAYNENLQFNKGAMIISAIT